jgi:hypothetical protein
VAVYRIDDLTHLISGQAEIPERAKIKHTQVELCLKKEKNQVERS